MPIGEPSTSPVIRIKASHHQRWPCATYCECACHTLKTFRSPSLLKQVVGILFVGYSGSPIRMGSPQRCTEAKCLSRIAFQTNVSYIFPSWLLAKALILGLTAQSVGEISISLKVQRIVPNGSEVFRLTSSNDVDGLKNMFRKGLASPHDVALGNQDTLTVRSSYLISYILGQTAI